VQRTLKRIIVVAALVIGANAAYSVFAPLAGASQYGILACNAPHGCNADSNCITGCMCYPIPVCSGGWGCCLINTQ
jgi:hypothetical protein